MFQLVYYYTGEHVEPIDEFASIFDATCAFYEQLNNWEHSEMDESLEVWSDDDTPTFDEGDSILIHNFIEFS